MTTFNPRADSGLLTVLDAIGTPRIGQALFSIIDRSARFEHLVIDSFDARLKFIRVACYSRSSDETLRKMAAEYHERELHLADPAVQTMEKSIRQCRAKEPAIIRIQFRPDDENEYATSILKKYGLSERMTVCFQYRAKWLSLRLFRSDQDGVTGSDEMHEFRSLFPLIQRIVGLHVYLLSAASKLDHEFADASTFADRLIHSHASLSDREVQVCARALSGMKNDEIANDLNLGVGSIRTFRQRAYRKLGVSNLQELFVECLRLKAI